ERSTERQKKKAGRLPPADSKRQSWLMSLSNHQGAGASCGLSLAFSFSTGDSQLKCLVKLGSMTPRKAMSAITKRKKMLRKAKFARKMAVLRLLFSYLSPIRNPETMAAIT